MPTALAVNADVIDIQRDHPQQSDLLLVDTNVWCWFAYIRITLSGRPPDKAKIQNYIAYIGSALAADATLARSGLSFAELAHVIERTECDIYNSGRKNPVYGKYFRNISSARQSVVALIDAAWEQVESVSQHVDVTASLQTVNGARALLASYALDGYDALLLEISRSEGLPQILTDDSDFAAVPGIQMFTANRRVVNAAKQVGKLVTR